MKDDVSILAQNGVFLGKNFFFFSGEISSGATVIDASYVFPLKYMTSLSIFAFSEGHFEAP